MQLEGVIHCSAEGCQAHEHVGTDSMTHGRLPKGWLTVTEHGDFSDPTMAFCGWDCLLQHAGRVPPPVTISCDEALGGGDDD